MSAPVEYVESAELRGVLGQPGVVIVDVREPAEREAGGHIEGSINKPISDPMWQDESKAAELREWVSSTAGQATTVVFHCQQSLQRGPKAARIFTETLDASQAEKPEVKVQVLRGGFAGWAAEEEK